VADGHARKYSFDTVCGSRSVPRSLNAHAASAAATMAADVNCDTAM